VNTRSAQNLALCTLSALCAGCMGPAVTNEVVKPTITTTGPKAVPAAEDPFNVAMLSNLAPGLIAVVHVTPQKIELVQAYIMLTPTFTRADRGRGDRIIASLSGDGAKISEAVVSDPTIAVEESFSKRGAEKARTLRTDDRSVAFSLSIPHRVDTLDIAVSATGQTAHFDVSRLLRAYCAEAPRAASCQAVPASR